MDMFKVLYSTTCITVDILFITAARRYELACTTVNFEIPANFVKLWFKSGVACYGKFWTGLLAKAK
jgi:hypothetical protein